MDGRSPSPGNSFMDMYISGKQAMIRRKAEMVSELQTLPPCTISDCQDHKIPSTSVEEENNFVPSPPVIENKIENKTKINSKSKKKFSKNVNRKLKSLSISKYMISILKAHCHPPINDRSIANASCTAIGSPPLKSRPSLQAQVSKTMKIRVPDRG
ncbi:hypothetical protein TNCV_3424191 [Trichonephila clavipes]|nr:hypothetical protein TNCV_3424191 [Trichonephila clavipes]